MPLASLDLSAHGILLVDDEIEKVQPLVLALKKRGFNLSTRASPSEAWSFIEEHPLAIILSDERMETMRGVDFLAQVAERYPHIVRILFTGFADHDVAVAAINRGKIFRYILKSQPIDDIALILGEAIHHSIGAEAEQKRERDARDLNTAEAALTVLRDARYDWGNVVLTQKLHFQNLFDLLTGTESRFNLDLSELKNRCEDANRQVEQSLQNYFSNVFFDSGLTEEEAFVDMPLFIPIQMAINIITPKIDISRTPITFHYNREPSLTAPIQRERLKAAVGLLLHNAVESIDSTGQVDVFLDADFSLPKPMAFIRVTDSGKGISSDLHDKIFEPLFKTLDKQGHMGIGLTFVRAIIRSQGGDVSVLSAPGQGSTFTLSIPLSA